jgi:hypothetical protein
MDDRLAFFPYVLVRIRCAHCSRRGAYLLARLAAKYGPEITLDELLVRLTADCQYSSSAHHPYRRICERASSILTRRAGRPTYLLRSSAAHRSRREVLGTAFRDTCLRAGDDRAVAQRGGA